jgi:hypothetical protein
MKIDWLNSGALRILPESQEEKATLVALFQGPGEKRSKLLTLAVTETDDAPDFTVNLA